MENIVKMIVRTKKEDSAFLYAILEANEGLAAYSTVQYSPHDLHRDVELIIPLAWVETVKELLKDLGEVVEILTVE